MPTAQGVHRWASWGKLGPGLLKGEASADGGSRRLLALAELVVRDRLGDHVVDHPVDLLHQRSEKRTGVAHPAGDTHVDDQGVDHGSLRVDLLDVHLVHVGQLCADPPGQGLALLV